MSDVECGRTGLDIPFPGASHNASQSPGMIPFREQFIRS